ncbi:MAG TPA: VOC family protein [Candidatus Aquilonibacter sp.]|nr:VOC family protein [Candidatus Aquilonibacter sp.]
MSVEFLGYDHVDCRVRSLPAVEAFYDDLLPALGLTEKRYAYVDPEGEWHTEFDAYNTVEYYEPDHPTKPRRFFGVIENPLHRNNDTRIAFRVDVNALDTLQTMLQRIGAQNVERSDHPTYKAIFFEDPLGTRLEFTGRA